MSSAASKSTGCLARGIAAILAVLFVIVTPLVLLLFNLQYHLLDSDLYKQALVEQNFYDQLPSLVGEQLVTTMLYNPCEEDPSLCEGEGPPEDRGGAPDEPQGGPPAYLQLLRPEDWDTVLSILLPQNWIQEQTEAVIDQAFAYLNGETEQLELTISTRELRQNLSGPPARAAILGVINALPPCTLEQLAELGVEGFNPEQPSLPSCKPPDELLDPLLDQATVMLGELASGIPDETSLGSLSLFGDGEEEPGGGPGPAGFGPFGADPLETLRLARQLISYSLLLPLALLLLIVPFAVRSLKGFLRWWGIPLLIAGLFTLLPALAITPALNWAIETQLIPPMPGYLTSEMVDVALGVLYSVVRGLADPLIIQAGILALLGLVMWIFSLMPFVSPSRK